ncbi:hypothetical protein QTO34_014281 [Cnephaeus nilssonii]|uniref:Uncharacterized protein n=1 Tax=Cnephaeus nilssonii TaxID=3371016 RepID=A0AA40I621_CNENI|nr:hypothetical protein QTO34_014281 [Eptesicus nilssonii]
MMCTDHHGVRVEYGGHWQKVQSAEHDGHQLWQVGGAGKLGHQTKVGRQSLSSGDYLNDETLWSKCHKPENVVSWNLTLFSILLIIAVFQMLLCTIQVVNGLLGTLCGDCCGKLYFQKLLPNYIMRQQLVISNTPITQITFFY